MRSDKIPLVYLVALTVSLVIPTNKVLAEKEQLDINKLQKFATGKVEEVSKKVAEKLPYKGQDTIELSKRH